MFMASGKRQMAKITPDFVFFSSNPQINHMTRGTSATSIANTPSFTLLYQQLRTGGKSFIFAVNAMLITSLWIGRQVTKMNTFYGNYVLDIVTKFYNIIIYYWKKSLATEVLTEIFSTKKQETCDDLDNFQIARFKKQQLS